MQLIYNLLYRFTNWLPETTTFEKVYRQPPGTPIFARNTADKIPGVCLGEVLVSYTVSKDGTTKSYGLRIPKTKVPIEVTRQMTRHSFLESTEIRKAIHSGMFELIDPRFAQYMKVSEEAKEFAEETKQREEALRKYRTDPTELPPRNVHIFAEESPT